MKTTYLAPTIALLLLAGCATTPQVPYRAPQATIQGATAEQVKLPIIQACVSGGGSVENSTEHQVICAKPMDDSFGSLMYRALATPQYSTNPVGRVRYTLVETAGSVFVTADMYLQHQNAFGQVNTTPITNGNIAAQGQAMLDRIKASIEGEQAAPGAAKPAPAAPAAAPTVTSPAVPKATNGQSDWRNWGQKTGG